LSAVSNHNFDKFESIYTILSPEHSRGNVLSKVIYKDFYLTWNVLLRYDTIR